MPTLHRRPVCNDDLVVEVDAPRPDVDVRSLCLLAGGEPRWGDFTGTKALMLAVLEDGIRTYLGGVERPAAEAENWVHSSRRRSPFSFIVVCETLNLDPDAVRRVLKRLRTQLVLPRKAFRRARPNVRVGSRLQLRKRR